MDRAALDSLDREGLIRIILMQFEAIERLTAEVVALRAENAELRTQNAELRAKLDQPPKTPDNSSLRAFIVYLRFTQGIGFERLSRLLLDVMGVEISEGALINILKAARRHFAAAGAAIRARLLAGTAICSDETGLRVGKRSWWLWVFHHDDSAFFMAHARRGKMAVAQFLGSVRPDFWVSDRYSSQMGWAKKDHQVCLAHLIRDIQYAITAAPNPSPPHFPL